MFRSLIRTIIRHSIKEFLKEANMYTLMYTSFVDKIKSCIKFLKGICESQMMVRIKDRNM